MSKKVRQRQLRRQQDQDAAAPTKAGMSNFQAGMVVAIGLAFCLAVAVELGGATPEGTLQLTHWTPWRDLGILRTSAILLPPFPLIAWVLWRAEQETPRSPWLLLGVLTAASFAMQALGILADPRGFELVHRIVVSPATSYFSDAINIRSLSEWLRHFHEIPLHFHSQTHPPGPILYYLAFVKLFGPETGATVGGWFVGLLASMGVPAMYAFAGLWTRETRARLTAAAFYALVPAVMLFFPEFDQVYPIVAMLLMLFWAKALDGASVSFAVGAGAILFVATFFAYNLLCLSSFLLYYAMYRIWRGSAWSGVVRSSAIAGGTVAAVYGVLWVAAGFNAIGGLQRSLAFQERYSVVLHRAYAPFVFLDMYDYFLGAGMIAFPILIFYLRRQWDPQRRDFALTLIGLATVLTIDLSGLLRGETARVWLFAQPLLVVPVALEIVRLPWRWKVAIFGLQWFILVCLKAKMTFLDA